MGSVKQLAALFETKASAPLKTPFEFEQDMRNQYHTRQPVQVAREKAARYNLSLQANRIKSAKLANVTDVKRRFSYEKPKRKSMSKEHPQLKRKSTPPIEHNPKPVPVFRRFIQSFRKNGSNSKRKSKAKQEMKMIKEMSKEIEAKKQEEKRISAAMNEEAIQETNRKVLSIYLNEVKGIESIPKVEDPEEFEEEVDRLLDQVRGREGSFFEVLALTPTPVENEEPENETTFFDELDVALLGYESNSDSEEPTVEEPMGDPRQSVEDMRGMLESFFSVYDTEKLSEIDSLLKKYRNQRKALMAYLERKYHVKLSEDGFSQVDYAGRKANMLREQLIKFYSEKNPDAEQKELDRRVNRMMNKYSFKNLAGAVRKLFGELPDGWDEELTEELDL